jgi:hypothetical protein
MKVKWKIGMGVGVLFAVIVFIFFSENRNVRLTEGQASSISNKSAAPVADALEDIANDAYEDSEDAAAYEDTATYEDYEDAAAHEDYEDAVAHEDISADVSRPSPPPTPPVKEETVDSKLNEMKFGAIAFNVPTNINIDSSHQIQLILSMAETVEQLKKNITDEGKQVGADIKVSDRMEARLSGHMFQITAISDEIQAVSKYEQTEWKWEIHPKKAGKHKLHLTLTALFEIDGRSTPRTIRTFDRIIEIDVSATQKIRFFFNTNWQWLWATILVPIAGWLWKRNKKPQKNIS